MNAIVFTGPTLGADEARKELDAIYLPPVAQGDVYRAALKQPRAIGIVDGYFDRVPSVWHKEILWAMSRGVAVFGSASMGALRAAELAPFGMIGVGRIFEDYRDGVIDADDEVAIEHGPPECGYRILSEPLVNIRQTLRQAEQDGVIASATASDLVRIATSLFYPQRSYSTLISLAHEKGLLASEVAALQAWIPTRQINQKRSDAIEMLRAMRAYLNNGSPVAANFVFERTALWDELTRTASTMDSHEYQNVQAKGLLLPVRDVHRSPVSDDSLLHTISALCVKYLRDRKTAAQTSESGEPSAHTAEPPVS